MIAHSFKYTLKTLFKNRMLIFWIFAFPIILGTLFNMAFSNIENNEKMDIIDIAIIETEENENNKIIKNAFEELSDENNEQRLFNTKYVTQEEAKTLLENNQIIGYLQFDTTPKLVINTNGIDQTILKQVVERISQSEKTIQKAAEKRIENTLKEIDFREVNNIEALYSQIYEDVAKILEQEPNIQNISSSNLSYTMIEFYTLIAMTCLYGGVIATIAINQNLPNMSANGKRVAVSPTSKGRLIIGSTLASYVIQLIGLLLLFLYTIIVLKIDYGNNLSLIVLLALCGSLAGLSLGVIIGVIIKTNETTKTGIIISVTMLGCFLSGMMGMTMKYTIDKSMPIINKLNPAAMITDGFYSLYYYETLDRYYFNIVSLLVFAFIILGISIFSLRRQKYDNI
ncbi:MAG: ABC transporter permease [Clostridia bacterium]|jgi:ABC-2 type transport system permease protein|nr:ABC transporter permease [Clostridia bacterium]